jgi:hypothetical protein
VTNAPSQTAPALLRSPVDGFRELLSMKPGERDKYLAIRPPEIRRRLLEKVAQYESMKPEARELALSATELHWYLERLLQSPRTNRAAQLASIPATYRQFVSGRLGTWDILPPDLQKQALEYESTKSFFLGPTVAGATNQNAFIKIMPPPLQQTLVDLKRITPPQRAQMYTSFQQFFDFTADEKQQILQSLPEAQRRQLDQNLQILERLPKVQRELGLQSVNKLAGMSDQERREFLRNVVRWEELSDAERQAWRQLVRRLPPLPPGVGMPIMPPMPPLPEVSVNANPSP